MTQEIPRAPWLAKDEIERRARGLLTRYAAFIGRPAAPPVPVEELIAFRELHLEFADLEELTGMDDLLGATWVEEQRIIINRDLPDQSPGRTAFTMAHELGHWELHRHLVKKAHRSGEAGPGFFTRDCDAGAPIERQADMFAAALLMPEEHVRAAYETCFGRAPLVMYNARSSYGPTGWVKAGGRLLVDPARESVPHLAGMVIEAGGFDNVSRQAMGIRLMEVGLLVDRTGE